MATAHQGAGDSEARRLRARLAAQNDRSDLMLAIVYPTPDRAAEDAELVAVETELASVREKSGTGPPK